MEEIKIITLDDGRKVEVSTEIYKEYYRPQWREEKCRQRDSKRLLSADYEYGNNEGDISTMKDYIRDKNPTPEEQLIKKEENKLLQKAISILSAEKQELIKALFYENKSEREYSEKIGVARTTINYKRKKALEEIKNYMEKHI